MESVGYFELLQFRITNSVVKWVLRRGHALALQNPGFPLLNNNLPLNAFDDLGDGYGDDGGQQHAA